MKISTTITNLTTLVTMEILVLPTATLMKELVMETLTKGTQKIMVKTLLIPKLNLIVKVMKHILSMLLVINICLKPTPSPL